MPSDRYSNVQGSVQKITDKCRLLDSQGLTRDDRILLEKRLNFLWSQEKTGISSVTKWRQNRARNIYLDILDANVCLFLAFILVIAPTDCGQISFAPTADSLINWHDYNIFHFRFHPSITDLVISISAHGGYAASSRCAKLLEAVSTQGDLQQPAAISSAVGITLQEHSGSAHSALVEASADVTNASSHKVLSSTGASKDDATRSLKRKSGDCEGDVQPRNFKSRRSGSGHLPEYARLLKVAEEDYCSFAFIPRQKIYGLAEPFQDGITTSNQWRKEHEQGGLAVTNCLSLFIPKIIGEDVIVVMKVGYNRGWDIAASVEVGEPLFGDS